MTIFRTLSLNLARHSSQVSCLPRVYSVLSSELALISGRASQMMHAAAKAQARINFCWSEKLQFVVAGWVTGGEMMTFFS